MKSQPQPEGTDLESSAGMVEAFAPESQSQSEVSDPGSMEITTPELQPLPEVPDPGSMEITTPELQPQPEVSDPGSMEITTPELQPQPELSDPGSMEATSPVIDPPHPLSIINFLDSSPDYNKNCTKTIQLHKPNLESILTQAGNRPLVIISIVGPSRRGKSFFLGFVLKYLQALESGNDPDTALFDNPEQPHTHGFKWRSGIEKETSGILMWSKPFILQSKSREVAVLLMDTQGTFDDTTTQREWSSIVGLSILSSSITIFNVFTDLQEDVLNSLESYIQYGLMVLGSEEKKLKQELLTEVEHTLHPFQRLLFLIRDWNNPTEYPYGLTGGLQFLQRKLEIRPNQPQNAKEIRLKLKKCFKKLQCFLMPNPGKQAKGPGFDGRISQLSTNFCTNIKEIMSKLMIPDELDVKRVCGQEILASEFLLYVQEYVEAFNMDDLPEPTTMIGLTAKIMNIHLVEKYKKRYQELINRKLSQCGPLISDPQLKRAHDHSANFTLGEYKKVRKLGDETLLKEHEQGLVQVMETLYAQLSLENKVKRSTIIQQAFTNAENSLKTKVYDELEIVEGFMADQPLKKAVDGEIQEIIVELRDQLSNLEELELNQIISDMETTLKQIGEQLFTLNQNKRLQVEKELEDLVSKSVTSYQTGLTLLIQGDPFMLEDQFFEHNTSQMTAACEEFDKVNKARPNHLIQTCTQRLNSLMDAKFTELETQYRSNLMQAEIQGINLISEFHQSLFPQHPKTLTSSTDFQLEEYILQRSTLSLAEFNSRCPYPETSPRYKSLLNRFKDDVAKASTTFRNEVSTEINHVEASYHKSVNTAFNYYFRELRAYDETRVFHLPEDLQAKHSLLLEEAQRILINDPKKGLHSHPEIFQDKLLTLITPAFESAMRGNNNRQARACSAAEKLQLECSNQYQNNMMRSLARLRDLEELQSYHKDAIKEAQNTFRTKCKVQSEDFMALYLANIAETAQTLFLEDLTDLFEIGFNGKVNISRNGLYLAQKYYREEMEKHFQNNVFIRSKNLESLHETVTTQAMTRTALEIPLTSLQKDDLKIELETTFKEFKDRNDMNVPTAPAIGIDLGTTYSCVGVYFNGSVKIIPNSIGKLTTPSYVSYDQNGKVQSVGEPAKKAAFGNPESTIFDAKRIIGRGIHDSKLQEDMKFWPFKVTTEDNVPEIIIHGKPIYPEIVSASVLSEMRASAERFLSRKVINAVITVPAYFTDGQRLATKNAAQIAGLRVLDILSEPVAAAIAYKLQYSDDAFRYVLIYDLGGGTFDAAVLRIGKSIIEVLAVDGDTHLGGEDFDHNLMKFCCSAFQRQNGIDLLEGQDSANPAVSGPARRRLMRLQLECEEGKISLTSCRKVVISRDAIWSNGVNKILDLKVRVSRDDFETANEPLFKRTMDIVASVLQSASLTKEKIDQVVLVGGSTKIPAIQNLLSDYFEGKVLNKTINPDEAVAYGAAIKAAQLNGQIAQESVYFNTIEDAAPMSLGIRVLTGRLSVIIPKNSKIPTTNRLDYATVEKNQAAVKFQVYQGEDIAVAENNAFLGEFHVRNIPPGPAGAQLLQCSMEIDSMGILHVTAVCNSTGGTNSISVTAHKRQLSRNQIKKIRANQRTVPR